MRLNVWVRIGIVIAASAIPFLGCLRHPFIWDDELLWKRLEPDMCSGWSDIVKQPYWGVGRIPPDTYRPLSLAIIYMEKTTFGENMVPYHLISLGLHAIVCLVVMGLVGRFAGPKAGWVTALLFAVHPIHAEAVGMIYGQLEELTALFVFLAICLYIHARSDGVRPWPFALSLFCGFCAACSKESGVMLPALLLLVRACWMVGKGERVERFKRFTRGLGWDSLYFIVPIPYLILRYYAMGGLAPDPRTTSTYGFTLGEHVQTVIVSLGHAMRLCTIPTGQGLFYGQLHDVVSTGWPTKEMLWIAGGVAVFAGFVVEIGWRRSIFGAGWFLIALFPVMNIIPSGVLIAERTYYLPSFGICFLMTGLFELFDGRGPGPRLFARCLLSMILAFYALAAIAPLQHWRDEETLFRTTVATHPNTGIVHLWMGNAIVHRWERTGTRPTPEEFREAKEAFARAYTLDPRLTDALVFGGDVAAWYGDRLEAERLLRQAVEVRPNSDLAQNELKKFLEESRTKAPAPQQEKKIPNVLP